MLGHKILKMGQNNLVMLFTFDMELNKAHLQRFRGQGQTLIRGALH